MQPGGINTYRKKTHLDVTYKYFFSKIQQFECWKFKKYSWHFNMETNTILVVLQTYCNGSTIPNIMT